jgi:hypothetical protein
MTRLLARAHVESIRLRSAVRRYWRRIVLGAVCGWFASSVLGAFGIVWLESIGAVRSEEGVALIGAAIVWSGIGLGALVAYAIRPAHVSTNRR